MKLNLTRRMFIGGLLSSGLAGCQSANPTNQAKTIPPKFDWGFIRFSEVRAFRLNWGDEHARAGLERKNGKLNSSRLPKGGILLDDQQVEKLKLATTEEHKSIGVGMCFQPHHAFAFYENGRVVGHLDICFLCINYYGTPQGFSKVWDLNAIANILKELGIPLSNPNWWSSR